MFVAEERENYISALVKICKFTRVSLVMETPELLNCSLKSGEAVKKEGLANALKEVLPISVLKKRRI